MAKGKLSEPLGKAERSTHTQDDAQDTNKEPSPVQASASIPATQTRWAKKNQKTHFGYKNPISVDHKHKMIRVTVAEVHDGRSC